MSTDTQLQDTAVHQKDNCLICKSIDKAIADVDLIAHLNAWSELNEEAPYGRCSLDNLALTENEMHQYGDMHESCARDFYE